MKAAKRFKTQDREEEREKSSFQEKKVREKKTKNMFQGGNC